MVTWFGNPAFVAERPNQSRITKTMTSLSKWFGSVSLVISNATKK
jgi:hypothetical protein